MCHKLCKKCSRMVLFAALTGVALYVIGCLKGSGAGEEAMEEMREKKDRIRQACRKVKDETMEIADEVRCAAQYSAGEVKDGWKKTGRAVRSAAENIRDDMKDMRDCAGSVFEDGDHA